MPDHEGWACHRHSDSAASRQMLIRPEWEELGQPEGTTSTDRENQAPLEPNPLKRGHSLSSVTLAIAVASRRGCEMACDCPMDRDPLEFREVPHAADSRSSGRLLADWTRGCSIAVAALESAGARLPAHDHHSVIRARME
jgi:hypothetical protein